MFILYPRSGIKTFSHPGRYLRFRT